MRMRKKKHTADRMTSLSDLFVQNGDNIPDFSEIFGNAAPLRLEIGCGKGDFVRQLSERDSGYNHIAMEKIDDVIVIAAEKYAASRGLGSLAPNGGWKRWDGETVPMGERVLIPDGMRGNVRFMRRMPPISERYSRKGRLIPSMRISAIRGRRRDTLRAA